MRWNRTELPERKVLGITRRQAEIVSTVFDTPEAKEAFGLVNESLGLGLTTAENPALFAGMIMYQNAINQHILAMELYLNQEKGNARPTGGLTPGHLRRP